MRRNFAAKWFAAVGIVLGLTSGLAAGQGALPSAEQLEMLQDLTPEQREAILDRITGGLRPVRVLRSPKAAAPEPEPSRRIVSRPEPAEAVTRSGRLGISESLFLSHRIQS